MTTSYDIALTRTLRAHRFWGGTRSNPWCPCGWDGPGEVPDETVEVYDLWIEHVHDRLAVTRRHLAEEEAYLASVATPPDHVPTGR